MEDEEMGRPPRHERTATHRRAPRGLDILRRGAGENVRLRGVRRCACGAEIKVDFSGPEDSIGATIARTNLDAPMCDECLAREEAERDAAESERKRVEAITGRVRSAGVPAVWGTLTFDQLREHAAHEHQAQAITLAEGWAEGNVGGVLLHGPEGRGKSLIAAAATVARCVHSGVRWLNVAELLLDLRMPFEAPEYVRAQRKISDVGNAALVLDDLDKLKPSEHQLQPIYVAINGWIEARQPLFVTLNRDLGSLAEWMGQTFGGPIASRLAGYCEVVEIEGDDWRLA